MTTPIPYPQRTNYYDGLTLTADNLANEQYWVSSLRQAGNRGFFSSGIASGLSVRLMGNVRVVVATGVALDAFGREIVLAEQISLSLKPYQTGLYYLVIRYNAYLTDYQETYDNNGNVLTAGFQREQQAPEVTLLAQPRVGGANVLLAMISIDGSGTAKIRPAVGELQRRHCNIRLGGLTLYHADVASLPRIQPGPEDTLTFYDPGTTSFSGRLSVTRKLGIQTAQLQARLSIAGALSKGRGLASSSGVQVTLVGGTFPEDLIAGDLLVAHPDAAADSDATEARTIARMSSRVKLILAEPFSSDLVQSHYSTTPGLLFEAANRKGDSVMTVSTTGNVALGKMTDNNLGKLINIDSEGYVGIGVAPSKYNLRVAGTISASRFVGDGSLLQGISSVWEKGEGKDIYYDKGNVAIGLSAPRATLDVVGGVELTGSGTLQTSGDSATTTVVGQDTAFLEQVHVGDCLAMQNSENQARYGVVAIASQSQLEIDFPAQIAAAAYSVLSPTARFSTVASSPAEGKPPVMALYPDLRVAINLISPMYTLDVGGTIHASDGIIFRSSGTNNMLSCDILDVKERLTVGLNAAVFEAQTAATTAKTLIASTAFNLAPLPATEAPLSISPQAIISEGLSISDTATIGTGSNQFQLKDTDNLGTIEVTPSLDLQGDLSVGDDFSIDTDGNLTVATIAISDRFQLSEKPLLVASKQTIAVAGDLVLDSLDMTCTGLQPSFLGAMQNFVSFQQFGVLLQALCDGFLLGYLTGTVSLNGEVYEIRESAYDPIQNASDRNLTFCFPVPKGSMVQVDLNTGDKGSSSSFVLWLPLGIQEGFSVVPPP